MASQAAASTPAFDPDTLRRRFKKVCGATNQQFQNFQIRVHRALSWYERALELDAAAQPDGRLLFGWIAFNGLYGTWDTAAGFAAKDGEAWKGFLGEVVAADHDGLIGVELQRLRPDVLALLENKFLDPHFWRDPSRPGGHRRQYHQAQTLFFERRWHDLLIFTFERLYVLRNQIVHGAATQGSRLNRQTLHQCCKVLESLLPIVVHLVIEHRVDDHWPPLCYPPQKDARTIGASTAPRRMAR